MEPSPHLEERVLVLLYDAQRLAGVEAPHAKVLPQGGRHALVSDANHDLTP
jgi:hypothetical protein